MSILSEYEEIRKRIGEEKYNLIGKFLKDHPQYTLSDVYYRESVWDEMEEYSKKIQIKEIQTEKFTNLINTIQEDIKLWEKLNNADKVLESYMYLNTCRNSVESGLYQLILNGSELWYGTLEEINAVVKTMIIRIQTNDNLDCQ